ncbi:MAG: hypothetical protein V1889_03255 [archaeon]
MRWGKLILLAQAFITLVLGIVFFSQVLTINVKEIAQSEIAIRKRDSKEITTTTLDKFIAQLKKEISSKTL